MLGIRKYISEKRRLDAELIPPSLILMFTTLLSRLLGMAREVLFATKFGAPPELDAYNAAFVYPDLLTKLFVLGAFSSAFIPIFLKYKEEGHEAKAWKLADVVTTWLFVILGVCSLILFVCAPFTVPGGFNPVQREAYIQLLRIMLLSPILLGISNVLTGILNAHHRFSASAWAPVMYNVGIIAGVLFFVPWFGMIWGLGIGVIFGTLLHAAVQVYPALKVGFRWHPDFDHNTPGVKEIGKMAGPRMIGMSISQLDIWIDVQLGSFLTQGSITLLNYANRLQSMPVGIFGMAIATACFPALVRRAARKDMDGFGDEFYKQLRHILYFTVPVSIWLVVMRVEIIRILFGHGGTLDWFQTRSIAFALALYSISIFAQSAVYLLNRAFYVFQDTKTPVIAGLISTVINSVLSLILVFTVHHFAMLALSYSIASIVNMILLMALLQDKLRKASLPAFLSAAARILFASVVMGIVMWGMEVWLSNALHLTKVFVMIMETAACSLVGASVFLVLTIWLGVCDLPWFGTLFKKAK